VFDIGFPELILVLVVSLLVIGPERLPETIRSIALWLGRLKRSFSEIKAEIETEIGADEIRQQLHNEKILQEFEKAKDRLNDAAQDINNEIGKEAAFIRTRFEDDPEWKKQHQNQADTPPGDRITGQSIDVKKKDD